MLHQLSAIKQGKDWKCQVCQWKFTFTANFAGANTPSVAADCPGVKRYEWREIPAYLKTEIDLYMDYHRVPTELPKACYFDVEDEECCYLFDVGKTKPSRSKAIWVSPQHKSNEQWLKLLQKDRADKERSKAIRAALPPKPKCPNCNRSVRDNAELANYDGVCKKCWADPDLRYARVMAEARIEARYQARQWASSKLHAPPSSRDADWVILSLITTTAARAGQTARYGETKSKAKTKVKLQEESAGVTVVLPALLEIMQIAVLAPDGKVLVNTHFKATFNNNSTSCSSPTSLVVEPPSETLRPVTSSSFDEIYVPLVVELASCTVVTYGSSRRTRELLDQTCQKYGLRNIRVAWWEECWLLLR